MRTAIDKIGRGKERQVNARFIGNILAGDGPERHQAYADRQWSEKRRAQPEASRQGHAPMRRPLVPMTC